SHKDHNLIALTLKNVIKEELSLLIKIKPNTLIKNRVKKFSELGVYEE
ncbi:MAG: acetyl-CoA carboxylase carboxyl transferase subunit alpha, partial [Chlorobiaceae bacterium]|nr:acetyl-CoA carboxylase carboxyl transferase subunit alpha [Chlorobiaceae bacterium]